MNIMAGAPLLRLGTRASALARCQADWVADRLRAHGARVELALLTTRGDQDQTGPVDRLGSPGVYTSHIQRALLEGTVDLAVHSLKDLPTDEVPGLVLAAVPERAAAHDALICREASSLDALRRGARVGTSSLRRRAQLLHVRSDLEILDLRGNIDTRLRRLDAGDFDALVLAEAGLRRLGLAQRITQVLPTEVMLPAVGQGALGIETRADDEATRRAVAALDDAASRWAVVAERALLAHLHGGCLAPVGAWARVSEGRLDLTAAVLSHDGRRKLVADSQVEPDNAASLGRRVAEDLLTQGAAELIEAARAVRSSDSQ